MMRLWWFLAFFVFTGLFFANEAYADAALPPGLNVPYSTRSKVTARCFKRGQEIIICVDTPGPCQISFGLVDAKGKYVAGPLNFEDERFGRKSFSLKFPYPSSEEQSVKYQFKAQGHLFRYKRVPVEEDASLGSKFRVKTGLADPSEYKFVLKDKKGQAFKLDIPVVFTKTPKGEISLFFNGLKIN